MNPSRVAYIIFELTRNLAEEMPMGEDRRLALELQKQVEHYVERLTDRGTLGNGTEEDVERWNNEVYVILNEPNA